METAREFAEKVRLTMICGACGASLPNEGCGHKANGVPSACLPSVDTAQLEAALKERDVETRRAAIKDAAAHFRAWRVAHHSQRAAAGEIPCAQVPIFADMEVIAFEAAMERRGVSARLGEG